MAKKTDIERANLDDLSPLAQSLVAELKEGANPLDALKGQDADVRALAGTTIERVVILAEGKMLTGVFLGVGNDVHISDPKDGTKRALRTWRIRVAKMPGGGDIIALLMDADQLTREFDGPKFRGPDGEYLQRPCVVIRGPQNETRSGRRVGTWLVAPQGEMLTP